MAAAGDERSAAILMLRVMLCLAGAARRTSKKANGTGPVGYVGQGTCPMRRRPLHDIPPGKH